MAKIQTSCPNCRQPMVAEIHQVIDVKQEPQLKELLLAGGMNLARCQACGFQGQLPVPLVFHDRDKELLLTFSPPEAGKTMQEKEMALAPLLKQVTDSLAPEERKGYLFQPQAMLTMNNLIKNVLLADGVTEEMLEKQQEQWKLLEKLFSLEGEALQKAVVENKELINQDFFALFAEIAQRVLVNQDEKTMQRIQNVQDVLMEETEVGRQIKSEAEEIRAASKSLEALGKNLTRESLLELVAAAPNRERVKAIGSMMGQAMDYEFFQLFTNRIEAAAQEERTELVERRNLLLKITEEIRKEIEERLVEAGQQIEQILAGESIEQELVKRAGMIDQLFVEALSLEMQKAEKQKDETRKGKIAQLLEILQKLTSPPEIKVIERLLEAASEESRLDEEIERVEPELAPRVLEYLTSLVGNYQEQISGEGNHEKEDQEKALAELQKVYNAVLRKSMQKNISS